MCGIAGVAWSRSGVPVENALLQAMAGRLIHRGPDSEGTFLTPPGQSPGAGLAFRRLAIIDLAQGNQPLSNEDGSIWITFNGEIYNYVELRKELLSRGHQFHTATDTEVIVHLYEDFGHNCVQHLRGMFAFAIWDDRKKILFAARDRLGKKPLLYSADQTRLLFASELKALLEVPGLERTVDPHALDAFLTYQYIPAPHSILKGIKKLPPAHWLEWDNGQLKIERYWKPPFDGPIAQSAPEALRDELRELLTDSVKIRLRSDVPLGAFLSGGIDSTIICGLMQKWSNRQIKTFSIGFPIAAYDERAFAREAADFLGTEHHEQVVTPSAIEILPKLVHHYDEPFADSSAIPMMYLSEMTRKQVTVALSGDGGDELFAGYERYLAVKLASQFDWIPSPIKKSIGWLAEKILPAGGEQKSILRRVRRLLAASGKDPKERYLLWISLFDESRRRSLYRPDFAETIFGRGDWNSKSVLMQGFREASHRDPVTQTTCADLLTYLPGDILTKVDIASMAYSLECRCPFLDHKVVEFACRLPIEQKIKGRSGKTILKETFADLLPSSIKQRGKMGFGVPLNRWFHEDLRYVLHEVLLSPRALDRPWFHPHRVKSLVEEHLRGTWDHSYRLWSLLIWELWQRTYLEGDQ